MDTEANVTDMEKKMTEMKPILDTKNKECGEQKAILEVETSKANQQKEIVAKDEAVVNAKAAEANAIQADCQRDLSEVLPELEAARKQLDIIDASKIAEIKAMSKSPPELVKNVMEVLMKLFEKEPEKKYNVQLGKNEINYWNVAKSLVVSSAFWAELKSFQAENLKEHVVKEVKKSIQDPVMKDKDIRAASLVAAVLWTWIKAMVKFFETNKAIQPKRDALAKAQSEADALNKELAIKRAALAEVQRKVDDLSSQLKEKTDEKDELQRRFDDCCIKLERARKLMVSLKEEKERWLIRSKELEVEYANVTGDVLIAGGMIAYTGAFTMAFREEIVKDWRNKCKENHIPCSEKFVLSIVLGDPVKLQLWKTQNLPSDTFSQDNAIIVTKSRRWPLCIDPQSQANRWIKSMERENKVAVIKFNDPNYMRVLENSVEYGVPLILEHDQLDMEPAINPVLMKQFVKKVLLFQ